MLASFVLAGVLALVVSDEVKPPQIAWQSDIDVAVAIAKDEQRPLLLALNMDGESASERIVREQYRDPKFVAAANRCVCVIGSVFRHNPRDYDDRGRRILCPRLGAVTCGEHIALEPKLFDRFFGGERIAPRHALITAEGEKKFDHFQLFDLRELETALSDAVKDAPEAKNPPTTRSSILDTWRGLFFEGLKKDGPLRIQFLDQLAASAKKQNFGAGAAEHVRMALLDCKQLPTGMAPAPGEGLLKMLATLDGDHPMTRFALLSNRAVNNAGAAEALTIALGKDGAAAIEKALADRGGSIDVNVLLSYARAWRLEGKIRPMNKPPRASVEALLERIDAAVEALKAKPDAAAALAELGRASLECARAKLDLGSTASAGTEFHLVDAENYLGQALAKSPGDLEVRLDLAKLAYVRGQFELEEKLALEVDAQLPPLPNLMQSDRETVEAALCEIVLRQETLRWIGDAGARLVNSRYGKDEVAQIEGMLRAGRAMVVAAISPCGDAVDWQSAISFYSVLGQRSIALLIAEEGAARFPTSTEIRNAVRAVAASVGRPELALEFSQRELDGSPQNADAAWHLGYDHARLAEWRRRMERPDAAIESYDRAIASFDQSLQLEADYAASARHEQALAAQGKGFAHLLAQRQVEAAEMLVAAAGFDPSIEGQFDGLERETVDLVDSVVEYRIGRPSPVDAMALLAKLERVNPGNPFWGRSLADAMLREGLRADGRHDTKDGDRCLEAAIQCAKHAVAFGAEDEENRVGLAQCLTVHAERMLERDDVAGARSCLAVAAPLFEFEAPAAAADKAALVALAARLREQLGDARPIVRPGR